MEMKKVDKMLQIMLKEAEIAYKCGEVPIGCIIIKDNKVISKAHNIKQKTHLPFNHAEVIAIKKATKKLKDWRLNDCDLYVTLEPCNMCKEIIKESRIKNVYYLLKSTYSNNTSEIHSEKINNFSFEEKYNTLLKDFFNAKR